MTPAVRTHQVTRYYPAARSDPVKAVDCVDLELALGEMAVVCGPSASGKTTLLSLIAGLDRPGSGRVELFGRPLAEMSDAALTLLRRTHVGLLFRDFKLLPGLSAWENVALPLVPMGTPLRQRKRAAAGWLDRLGVAEVADRPPEQLSGGQQQHVALARALVNDPQLVLADEPTSQVDAASAETILATFEAMVAHGKTVIITTHDPTLVRSCPRRYHMIAGRLEHRPWSSTSIVFSRCSWPRWGSPWQVY
jgi:putative ABC transport system ATP-binding protein